MRKVDILKLATIRTVPVGTSLVHPIDVIPMFAVKRPRIRKTSGDITPAPDFHTASRRFQDSIKTSPTPRLDRQNFQTHQLGKRKRRRKLDRHRVTAPSPGFASGFGSSCLNNNESCTHDELLAALVERLVVGDGDGQRALLGVVDERRARRVVARLEALRDLPWH